MEANIIRMWYNVFKANHELVEIRVIDPSARNGKKIYSGYFTDVETILAAIAPYDYCQIYFTLNRINEACYNRIQRDRLQLGAISTSAGDIVGRDWCLIDIDVVRPAGTNASDAEVETAKVVANNVCKFLRDEGFTPPVVCLSGNGVHLLIRQNMANTEKNTETMKRFLQVLDMLFSAGGAHIDCAPHDPNRICKLYGCVSRKGVNSPDRPQRLSTIVSVPEEIKPTPNEYFEKVAAMLPQQERPSRFNGYSAEKFDIESFVTQHGIGIAKRVKFSGGEKLVLNECPFCSDHKAPDSALFVMDSGAIGFKCLHHSCQQYTWRDVRLKFDPQAYDQRDYKEFQHKQSYYGKTAQIQQLPIKIEGESKEKGKKWLQMTDIAFRDPSQLVAIPTGIVALDKKVMGLIMGDVTIISGISGAGKTSVIDFFLLNAAQRGYVSAVWSGELQDFRFQSWLDQMAAGPNFVRAKEGYDGLYYAPKEICDQINHWLEGKIYLYNNEYGNKFSQIFADIKECVKTTGAQLLVVDNLMALQLDNYYGEKNDRQTGFINDLKDYAKRENVHIVLVCHPRKEQGFQLLRMESISGTADLTNLADNCFIIHRVGRDFKRRAKDFFGAPTIEEFEKYDSVIEVCKNRAFGIKDHLIGLYYDKPSRRYKNDAAEHIIYGWQEDTRIDDLPEVFDTSQPMGWVENSDETPEEPEQAIEDIDDLPF